MLRFPDGEQKYAPIGANAKPNPDANITLSKATLDRIQLKEISAEEAIASGDLKIDGKREAFAEFMGLLDTYPFWFRHAMNT
jgi:alkyl sulfatase BDS1-like metallo-beta-lactamase superfamily hydrolase